MVLKQCCLFHKFLRVIRSGCKTSNIVAVIEKEALLMASFRHPVCIRNSILAVAQS